MGANAVVGSKVKGGTLQASDHAPGVIPPSGAIVRTRTAAARLGTTGNTLVTVMTATSIPAGSYVAVYRGDVVNFNTTATSDAYMRCQLEAPSGTVIAGATTYAWANDLIVNQVTITDAITLGAPTDVRIRCSHDAALPGEPYVENNRLVLIRVKQIDKAAVTG